MPETIRQVRAKYTELADATRLHLFMVQELMDEVGTSIDDADPNTLIAAKMAATRLRNALSIAPTSIVLSEEKEHNQPLAKSLESTI